MTNPAVRRPGATLLVLAGLLAVLAPGCAVGGYFADRGLDLIDVFDIKYGTCIGVGAKTEITYYLGFGAGGAALGTSREWYGRRSIKSRGFAFAHAGVIGVDGGYGSPNPDGWSEERADVYFLLVNGTALADFMAAPGGTAEVDVLDMENREHGTGEGDAGAEGRTPLRPVPPPGTRWRFGAEVLLPGGLFGLYLNLGELVDFLVGLTTFDIMDDDGVGKGELYPSRPRSEPRREYVL